MELIGLNALTDPALLLLTLGEARGPIRGRKRLQKTVCVLKLGYRIPFACRFRPYYYGPYSDQLVEALEVLRASNLVEEKFEILPNGFLQYDYELTNHGKKLFDRLRESKAEIASEIRNDLQAIMNLRTDELVKKSKDLITRNTEEMILPSPSE